MVDRRGKNGQKIDLSEGRQRSKRLKGFTAKEYLGEDRSTYLPLHHENNRQSFCLVDRVFRMAE